MSLAKSCAWSLVKAYTKQIPGDIKDHMCPPAKLLQHQQKEFLGVPGDLYVLFLEAP